MFGVKARLAMVGATVGVLSMALAGCGASASTSSAAPKQIVVGTLYSGSGSYAVSSLPELAGLKFWIKEENKSGGVYVGAYHKKIKLKLIALNDQSSTTTATTLYEQLVTQDNINIFVADFGSVLTVPAVTIAEEHHILLFDQSGTGAPLFTASNKYIVLCDLPLSAIWPDPLGHFILSKHITKVAIVYGSNDFDATQAATLKSVLHAGGVNPVYYQAVPTATTSYGTLLDDINATHPQAVLELGYAANDIPFLEAVQQGGYHFDMVGTAFPGQEFSLFQSSVGSAGLKYTFTYGVPPVLVYNKVNEGMGTTAFIKAFANGNESKVSFEDIAGYNTGLVIQAALDHAKKFTQLGFRAALFAESGKLHTIDGAFKLNSEGGQVGELLPVAQIFPTATGTELKIIYPAASEQRAAVYPAPAS